MANIILKSVGPNKVKVIAEYRLLTQFGLKEAKEAVDGLEKGNEIVISMEGADQELIDLVIKRFIDIGAYAYEDKFIMEKNSFGKAIENSEKKSDDGINEEIEKNGLGSASFKEATNAGTLDRETTMKKLIDAGKVVKKLEDLSVAKSKVISELNHHKSKVEEIRQFVPKNSRLWIGPVILMIVSAVTTLFMLLPIGVIIGGIWYWVKLKKYKAVYLQEHSEENNRNAENYIAENITPLEAKLKGMDNEINDLYESGKVADVVDLVGEDMFAYGCIEDLYNLIKSRKADNLKEALNLYDDSIHKARMEEMQAAIQNASEVAAVEAAKQTALTKDIARNTHQAATAAKASAYHTRQIDKNTRRFR